MQHHLLIDGALVQAANSIDVIDRPRRQSRPFGPPNAPRAHGGLPIGGLPMPPCSTAVLIL